MCKYTYSRYYAMSEVNPPEIQINDKHRKPEIKCPHGKRKRRCKDCGGSGICEHQRDRSSCIDCGGSQIKPEIKCPYGRRQRRCKDCGGSGICEHQRDRSS